MFSPPRDPSPFTSPPYLALHTSKQALVHNLLIIFTYYAGKVGKYNYIELHQKYFLEIAKDVKGGEIKHTEAVNIQNLYYSIGCKKKMDFKNFLDILPALASLLFPQKSIQNSTKQLLTRLNSLNKSLKQNVFEPIGLQISPITPQTTQFLQNLAPDLCLLYKLYFPQEITLKFKEKQYYHCSFLGLLEMMKEFDVWPKLVSASHLFIIFNELQNQQNQQIMPSVGQYFTLNKLAISLIVISSLCLPKLKKIDQIPNQFLYQSNLRLGITQKSTIKLLLEYMQTVRGLKSKKQGAKHSKQRFSLIVYNEYAYEQEPQQKGFYQVLSRVDL